MPRILCRTCSFVGLLLACFCWYGCGGRVTMPTPQRAADPDAPDAAVNPPASPIRLTLRSTAFAGGGAIPIRHTADGNDISPPLTISDAPPGVQEFALICEDPDAPGNKPWVHWLLYKIPGDTTALPANIPHMPRVSMPAGAVQGVNSFGNQVLGYRGPAPPAGRVHHYHFRLYALDAALDVKPGLDKQGLLSAMQGHVLAETDLVGTYHR